MNPSSFQKLLDALGRADDTIRFAHASPAGDFRAQPVPAASADEFVTALNTAGRHVWFEINPSHYEPTEGRSSAVHIRRLAALWADLDAKPGGVGSIDACWTVIDDLSAALGVQPAVVVASGGGLQPYWPILDGVITESNRDAVAQMMKRWGVFVQSVAEREGGAVDNVFDLARIFRVPGSFNVKDPANPKEVTATFAEGWSHLEMAEIEQMLDDYSIEAVPTEVGGELVSKVEEWEWAVSNCQFADMAMREVETSNPTSRHHWALKWTALLWGMVRQGCVTEAGFEQLKAALVARFRYLLDNEGSPRPFNPREMEGLIREGLKKAQQWSDVKLASEMRNHVHDGFFSAWIDTPTPSTEPASGAVQQAAPVSNVTDIFSKLPAPGTPALTQGSLALAQPAVVTQRMMEARFTDIGNSERLGQWLHGRFIYVPKIGWHEWSDGRWQVDDAGRVAEATKDMLVQMHLTAMNDGERDWATKSMSKAKIVATLELTKTLGHLTVDAGELDADAYSMNTPGGVLNLRTGELLTPDPRRDLHTLQAGFAPDDREIPRFIGFLMWAMSGDAEMVAYLQRLFGLAAVGKLMHHIFPIWLGVGANGKSTMMEILLSVFGSYGMAMPRKFLVEQRQEAHPTMIAQLRGVRLASSNEVPPSAIFDEELVKALTGEPRLRARYMGKDFFWFPNTTTHMMQANHAPGVRVGGASFWRRTRKIDFRNVMPLEKQNPLLADEIVAAEGPGILRWVAEGARDVMANGLRDPEKVMIATRDYQLEEDVVQRFLAAHIVDMPGVSVEREILYDVYKRWAFREDGEPLSRIKFYREIATLRPESLLGQKDVFSGMRLAARYDANPGGFFGGDE